ncbi:LysR family transcriptional regulator [Streptomyces scabiei]|uniref:LysR family transcriptional regulator n=1 Tax=Streptomyces scabiei TaxID=1930 RepID=UPI0029A14501|nr:LysR family transcriptional regulator [Streptomyces scabiei]MDX2691289.1 LysR family transcriptional regulator [Streptomyces scabiei]MDX3053312.1 LysR family transcriptional regulator [Streptomyces scabiei]
MDTRLLRTFTTLARTGGFTSAAAELHLAQSTVTVHIRTLEKELGTRLFDRLPTGTLLTESGRRLLEGAEEVLDAVARLRAGRLDLALLLEDEADFPEITAEPVAHEPLALVCAPGHPLAARKRPAGWARLATESFFLLEQGCSYSDALERRLLALPGTGPRLTRFGSVDAARSCAAAGLGLTLLPLTTVAEYLEQGRLTRVPGPGFADVPVRLARHRRRWTAPATEAFATELVRQLGA